MEALTNLYSLVHSNIQKDMDDCIEYNGVLWHSDWFCVTYTLDNYYFTRILKFNKEAVFNRDAKSNTCVLYQGSLGMGVGYTIMFDLNAKMYLFKEKEDAKDKPNYTYATTDWIKLCEYLDGLFNHGKEHIVNANIVKEHIWPNTWMKGYVFLMQHCATMIKGILPARILVFMQNNLRKTAKKIKC